MKRDHGDMKTEPTKTVCRHCSCSHDGCTPGFEVGECDCHRIGGAFIYAIPHEYEPEENESDHD